MEAEMCKYKSKYFLVLREFQKPRKGKKAFCYTSALQITSLLPPKSKNGSCRVYSMLIHTGLCNICVQMVRTGAWMMTLSVGWWKMLLTASHVRC